MTILFGDVPVEVSVVEIRAGQVRLGFTAPHHVEIYRSEVMDRRLADAKAEPEAGKAEAS